MSTRLFALVLILFCTSQSFAASVESDLGFGSLDLQTLDLPKIRAIAEQESDIWLLSSPKDFPRQIGSEELAGLTGFAQKILEWYKQSKGSPPKTPKQLLDSLLSTAFESVLGKAAGSLTDDLLKDAEAVKADPNVPVTQTSVPDIFTIIYGRLFIAQYGWFLANGLSDVIPENIEDVQRIMEKAIYRGRTFALCIEKVKWLSSNPSSPQARKFTPAMLQDLLQRNAKLEEELLPKVEDDASRVRLSADLVSAAVNLESELVQRLDGIDARSVANMSPVTTVVSPSEHESEARNDVEPLRPKSARLRLVPHLVPSNDGSPLYQLELCSERPLPSTQFFVKKVAPVPTSSQENTPDTDNQVPDKDCEEQFPLGYTVYAVRKNGAAWVAAGEAAKANASFDNSKFRKYLISLGVPLALIPEQAEGDSNPRLFLDPTFTTVTVAFTLRVPEIRFSTIATLSHEQRVSVTLKIGDETGDVDKTLIAAFQSAETKLAQDFEKDLSGRLGMLPNKIKFVLRSVKNAGWSEGIFAYDLEARETDDQSDTTRLFIIRVVLDLPSGRLSVRGVQVEDRLRTKLRETVESNLRPIVGAGTERLCLYAQLGAVTTRNDPGAGPTLETTLTFDLTPLAETVPSIKVTYQPLSADAVPKCDLAAWRDWAKSSLKIVEERINSLVAGSIQKEIARLNQKEFTICAVPRITAGIKNSKYLGSPTNAYEVELALTMSSLGGSPTGPTDQFILQDARLIGGYNEATQSLELPRFDLTHCKIKDTEQLRKRVELVLDSLLSDSKFHVGELRVGGSGLTFEASADVPELGLTLETGELTIRLDGQNPDFVGLVAEALRKTLESKLLDSLPAIDNLGPLQDVRVDSAKSQVSTDGRKQRLEIWLKANAKVWKEIKVPLSIQIFPKFTVEKGDASPLFSQVTELLQGEWNLPGGFVLKKAEGQELFDLNPLQINLDAGLTIPPVIGVSVKGIHVSRRGVSGANNVKIKSELLTDTLVAGVSSASGTWVYLYDPSLIISLSNAGSVGITGNFCINNRATAVAFYMEATLMANFASSQGLSFDFKGQLWFVNRFPLFDLTGTINLREAKAECDAKTEGFFARVLDADLNSRLSFKEGSYSQNARISVFGLHLGKADFKVALKGQPSAEAVADVNLPLLGHGDATFRTQIAARPVCELTVRIVLSIFGIDLGHSTIDINVSRVRLACHALGCRVIILAPNIESLTPDLIIRYLKSIFHLGWPDFKALVKREIVLGPDGKTSSLDADLNQVAPNGLQNVTAQMPSQSNGSDSYGGTGNETNPGGTGNHTIPGGPNEKTSPGPGPGTVPTPSPPTIGSLPLALDPTGVKFFASARTRALLKEHPNYRQLPSAIETSDGKAAPSYVWYSRLARVYSLFVAADDHKIYPISFDDKEASADADNDPLDSLPLKESDLFPNSTGADVSLLPINHRLLYRALTSNLSNNQDFTKTVLICPPTASPSDQFEGVIDIGSTHGANWVIDWFDHDAQEPSALPSTEADLLKQSLPGPGNTSTEKRIYLLKLFPFLSRDTEYSLKFGDETGSLWFSKDELTVVPFKSSRSVFKVPLLVSAGSSWSKTDEGGAWSAVFSDLLQLTESRTITPSTWSVLAAIDDRSDKTDPDAALIGWFNADGGWEIRTFKLQDSVIAQNDASSSRVDIVADPQPSASNTEDEEDFVLSSPTLVGPGVVDGSLIRNRFELQSFVKFSDWAKKLDLTKKADQMAIFNLFMSPPDEWSEHFAANPIGLLSN